ncbi:MAG: hypothetical protein JSS02_20635 [Planctomycetes bacterium]|nr:hypothetical protein [Planctomycetota bacterium]
MSIAIGVAAEFVKPTNLTMSLVALFQFAVLILAYIWLVNWRPRSIRPEWREQIRGMLPLVVDNQSGNHPVPNADAAPNSDCPPTP